MRDFCVRSIPKEANFKDVVIIGNGPSGISLSYMLAGNWPYWDTEKLERHPDELLRARLNYADGEQSLVLQDLMTLADGLEGRSTNPVSLLLDSLEHPCADIGMELPSMLEYKSHPNAMIDHVVLGKGPPGGSWHRMDPNLRTLSLAAWMSLPGLSFSDWETRKLKHELTINQVEVNCYAPDQDRSTSADLYRQVMKKSVCQKCVELRLKPPMRKSRNDEEICENVDTMENNNESESGALCCKCTKALTSTTSKSNNAPINVHVNSINEINAGQTSGEVNQLMPIRGIPPRRNLSLKRQVSKEVQTRALVSRVAQYYEEYVKIMELDRFFINDTIVTMITPIPAGCAYGRFKQARWLVCGINKLSGRPFSFACRNVVLANGASDLANRLGLKGETTNVSWVKHELPQLEAALEAYSDEERSRLKTVLVVGAGLSAADAVTLCRLSDINVIHVFRSRTAGLDKMLPQNVYPEYHEVHKMMKDSQNTYEHYTPLPEHTLADVSNGPGGTHRVTVQNIKTGETKVVEVSFCAILIGSRPDLRFASPITKCPSRTPLSPTLNSINNEDKLITTQNQSGNQSPIGKRISWLKNICAKCKHLNLCEWSLRSDYRKICGHVQGKICECKDKENPNFNCPATLDDNQQVGLGLGIDPTKPIDCKNNQIAVDKYSNHVLRAPKGLYAMGPLVGDNFVRFIPGGALAIVGALHREND